MARLASSSPASRAPPITCTGLAVRSDVVGDAAIRFLAGADDDGVGRQHLIAVRQSDVEALAVDLQVAGFGDLSDFQVFQFLPKDPAGALAERPSERAGRALDHGDLPPRRMGFRLAVDAPALKEFFARLPAAVGIHGEEQRHVVADAAAADDDDALAGLRPCRRAFWCIRRPVDRRRREYRSGEGVIPVETMISSKFSR